LFETLPGDVRVVAEIGSWPTVSTLGDTHLGELSRVPRTAVSEHAACSAKSVAAK